MKKLIKGSLFAVFAVVAFMGCDQNSNRNAATRPFYGQGYNYNQPYYQNCGMSNYQYQNPYNNQQIYCQYGANGMPQFMNSAMQPFQTDMYGNPCLAGGIDPTTGYCLQPQYYPMYYGM